MATTNTDHRVLRQVFEKYDANGNGKMYVFAYSINAHYTCASTGAPCASYSSSRAWSPLNTGLSVVAPFSLRPVHLTIPYPYRIFISLSETCELESIFTDLRWKFDAKLLNDAIRILDKDESGTIEWEEFVKWAEFSWQHKVRMWPLVPSVRLPMRGIRYT